MRSSERVICAVQARMGSTRLPGKVLEDLAGRPVLDLLLERLSTVGVDELVVATSTSAADDPLAAHCRSSGVPVVRGSEQDVLDRYRSVLDRHPAGHVVRITADCPFTDPAIVDRVLAVHLDRGADHTSNVLPRTFPVGLDVEVVRAEALVAAASAATLAVEREHVTPFLYRHPERFRLANLRSGLDAGDERWTLDTPGDLEVLRSMAAAVAAAPGRTGIDSIGWVELMEVVGRRADRSGARLRPADRPDAELLRRWRNDSDSVRYSRSGAAVSVEEHEVWLMRVLDDPAVELSIVELDGVAAAMVRLDVRDATGLVSIAVDPDLRGRGIGGLALELLEDRSAAGVRLDRLIAEVHRDNISSRRLFERAGFVPTREDGDLLISTWTSPRVLEWKDGTGT